jgi:protein TonB
VVEPSPDPEADRITCRLAEERFRFRPARNAGGEPVAAQYGWRQRWF